jgi:ribonuclease HII
MAYLIGTDEAGYGPNLGPLLISATLWRVPDALMDHDLYALCRDWVGSDPVKASQSGRLVIADSKALYKSRGRLKGLEANLLAALAEVSEGPASWLDAWRGLSPDAVEAIQSIPWYAGFSATLPLDADRATIERLHAAFHSAQQSAVLRLLAVRSVALFPSQFNRLVEQRGGKGAVLSEQTLALVARLIADLGDEPVLVQCDKHGGRNRYGAVLQHAFADQVIRVLQESRGCSRYQWGPASRRVEIRFTAGGESFLPAALASMASKYLRELAMTAFNAFWSRHVPGIRPTAGYPVDAKRFKAEIAHRQRQLGISDTILWRNR